MATPASPIKLIECPRDAMQGWPHLIATDKKIAYINALLKVGFDTIDFGSFVSQKAIPQMADTADVIKGLQPSATTKLLAIVANIRGAHEAVGYDAIDCLGFPFSISPTFQLRNTNSTMQQSLAMVEEMQSLCVNKQKKLVVYISMGFGNIYGDEYNEGIVVAWIDKIASLGVTTISIADTVGLATPLQVARMMQSLLPMYPAIEIGVHLHAVAATWKDKVDAALQSGCQRFDGALKGIGGCPMAGNELIGNMDTAVMIPYFKSLQLLNGLNEAALLRCSIMADELFKV